MYVKYSTHGIGKIFIFHYENVSHTGHNSYDDGTGCTPFGDGSHISIPLCFPQNATMQNDRCTLHSLRCPHSGVHTNNSSMY